MNTVTANTLARELQSRPPVQIWGGEAMVSSAVPESSLVAADVLRNGGNAVDAAIALASSLAVTTHHWAGMAGDTAWLVYRSENNSFHHLDGYSRCPARLTADFLQSYFRLDKERDAAAFVEEPAGARDTGAAISMIPGSPAAWYDAWQKFGSKPFESLIAGAIRQAEAGIVVNRYLAEWLKTSESKLAQFPSSKRIFFRTKGATDRVYAEGETLVQSDLAQTLRRYASAGSSEFYMGETARALVAEIERAGGVATREDFESYRPGWRECVRGRYGEHDIVVTGPPTAGIHVVQALNILTNHPSFRQAPYHSAESLHVLIQACRLALADRRTMVGDPDHMVIDVDHIISAAYGVRCAGRIETGRVTPVSDGGASRADQTTHYVVIDRARNIVCGTQSIGMNFGCGQVAEGTGLCLNDRSWAMSLRAGPNQVRPGHRPNIGHAPTIVMGNGKPLMALGSPGGLGIVQYVVQTLVNVLDFGMDIQQAIEAPRFRVQDLVSDVGLESRIDPTVRERLTEMGHRVIVWPEWTNNVGGVEAFAIDQASGNILGGYDPRRNSLAVGL
jgi:gamma-glutamyltranspeptidase/glutathione hydrolase